MELGGEVLDGKLVLGDKGLVLGGTLAPDDTEQGHMGMDDPLRRIPQQMLIHKAP